MKTSDFDYSLPESLIAHHPISPRDHSRLLVVNRQKRTWSDHRFDELPTLLSPSDRLVINTTKVIPARVITHRSTGGKIEVLFSHPLPQYPDEWYAMIRSAKKLHLNEQLHISPNHTIEFLGPATEPGLFHVKFIESDNPISVLNQFGEMPLPPYISALTPDQLESAKTNYQSVFAQHSGAIAAPTASLHFTPDLMAQLAQLIGPPIPITLHVGIGTFQPVKAEKIKDHHMHKESYSIDPNAANQLNQAIQTQSVVAVGTTVLRTLESAWRNNQIVSETAQTDIFIYPGIPIQTTSKLITNFHLPKSTLLMLVCAFADRELIMAAYHHAIQNHYRFYSYGDAMMIV